MHTTRQALALLLLSSAVYGQGASRAVTGTVRDSATGRPLAGALIELRGGAVRRAAQSDEDGTFRLVDVSPGGYRLVVRRLGYAAWATDLDVPSADLDIDVALLPVARDLDTLYVRAGVTGIYGVVGTSESLSPIVDAKVQVLGSGRFKLTDSAGGFFVPLEKPGLYVVRVSRAGYVQRMFTLTVTAGAAVDASRLLDSSRSTAPGLEVLWQDMDKRLNWRAMNSALVPGTELRRAGGSLTDALEHSASYVIRGLTIGNSVCVYLNGTPRPLMPLDATPIEEIEVVELYGSGDAAMRFLPQWPNRAPCGYADRIARYESRQGHSRAIARYAVIWLKR